MRVKKAERSAKSDKDLFKKKSRHVRDLIDERDSGFAHVRNFDCGPDIDMFWGWNDAVEKDQIFKLRIKNTPNKRYTEVLLDAEDLRRHLRWV